jgi:succinoglycan biosynthesis protein ExoA
VTAGEPRVSVLVPVLDEIEHIEASVARMRDQRFDGEIEILLVDGGSTDGTREKLEELAREDGRLRVLDNPAGSIPAALNIGLRESSGRYVARMDAHTYYPLDYLARGVGRLEEGGVAWVSGPALPMGVDPWSRRVALALGTWLGVGAAGFRRLAPGEFESDTGFCGVWLRETLVEQDGWDERSLVNEDAELAARVRKAGGRIVCVPELAASYVPRASLRALARQYWRYGQYRARTSRLHPESMRRSNLLPPALALTVAAALVAPGAAGRAARAALGVYAVAVAGVSAAQVRGAGPRDAVALPAVFAAMHLPWGFGFLVGTLRFGPPAAAVARAVSPRPQHGPGAASGAPSAPRPTA